MDGNAGRLQDAITEGLVGEKPVASGLRVSDPKYQGLAAEKGYDQSYSRVAKTSYSHEAMVDMIIAEPRISQNQLAAAFGYSVAWISRVMGSDAFQAYLAKRREEISDPFLIASIEERLRGLVTQSLDVLCEKLESTKSADLAIKALDIGVKSLGFGARQRDQVSIQNNFVVAMPQKAQSESEWAAKYTTIEAPPARALSSTIDRDPTIQPSPTTLAD